MKMFAVRTRSYSESTRLPCRRVAGVALASLWLGVGAPSLQSPPDEVRLERTVRGEFDETSPILLVGDPAAAAEPPHGPIVVPNRLVVPRIRETAPAAASVPTNREPG